MSSNEKSASEIREKINYFRLELEPYDIIENKISAYNACFRSVVQAAGPSPSFSLRSVFKCFAMFTIVQTYKAFQHTTTKGEPLCYFQHRSGNAKREFWLTYEKTLFNETKKTKIWIDSDRSSYKISVPTIRKIQTTHKIFGILSIDSAGFWELLLLWSNVYGCVSSALFHAALAEKHRPSYFAAAGPSTLPHSIFFEYYKNLKVPTFSGQLFNLSEDNMFKPDTESVWLNMQCETFYVWGESYRDFLQSRLPLHNIIVVGHPTYTTLSAVTPKPQKDICLAINPKQPVSISQEWLKMVEEYCKNTNSYFCLRLHPLDLIQNYEIFSKSPYWMERDSGKRYWYVVNNSTVYYDLILLGEWVLRYKHPLAFLPIPEEVLDYVQTPQELESAVALCTSLDTKQKQEVVSRLIFNIF